jgi:predicted ATPase
MITRVRVKNFRSLADVDVTLGPLTVLVGRNGAGKSAFVDALCFVRDALRSGIDEAIRKRDGFDMLKTWCPNECIAEMSFEIFVKAEDFEAEYGFTIAQSEDGTYSVSREFAAIESANFHLGTLFEIKDKIWITAPPSSIFVPGSSERMNEFKIVPDTLFLPTLSAVMPDATFLLHFLRSSDFYGIFPIATLRTPQARQHWFPLSRNASNLYSVLWKFQEDATLPIVTAAMRCAIDDIEDIRVTEVGNYLTVQLQHAARPPSGKAPWFELAQESDGTIQALALLASLYQSWSSPERVFSIISLEEPETALHPGALGVLSGVVREASVRNQIIVTTQSPDFISEFKAHEIRIAEKKYGATQIGPLLEEQLDAINKELFTTGDLLRIEGLRTTPFEAVSIGDA